MDDMFSAELRLDDGTTALFRADGLTAEYEVAAIVNGRYKGAATHAVFAHWSVENEALKTAFEDSRRALFLLRQENIDSFVCDVLLRRRGSMSREYVVVGLYGDEDGRSTARSHPAIVEWASTHPAEALSAVDTSGMILATVVAVKRT